MEKYSDENALSPEKQAIIDKGKEEAIAKIASFQSIQQKPYPSPYLDIGDMKIPQTSLEIFTWCKYYYMFDQLISGAIHALASFPITEVYFEDPEQEDKDEDSEKLKTYKRVFNQQLNLYKFLIEIGIDYYLYGNCFVFGEFTTNKASELPEWKNIIRLDPSKMIIDNNPVTQEITYKWRVPEKIAKIVKTKKPAAEYNKIPDIIKRAVAKKKVIVLKKENIYHFSRPCDSMGNNGVWGTPGVANVLKLLMYRNTLRQAQEAIAREHIVPFRIYYLDKTDMYNPGTDWQYTATNFASELQKAAMDPNYKVVSPVPVQALNFGGQGRALLLTNEIEQIQAEILAGMNLPREFIFGGVSFSGSSISLKILENQFITYRLLIKDFIQNFLIKGMAKARGEWKSDEDNDSLIRVKLQDLKMQDDVQQKQLVISLNQQGKCSDDLLWKTMGFDSAKMREAIDTEMMAALDQKKKVALKQAEVDLELGKKQIENQLLLQKYQMELQGQLDMGNMGGNPQIPPQEPTEQPEATQMEQQEQSVPPQSQPNTGASEQVRNLALQLMKIPKANRDASIAKFPSNIQQAIIAELENLQSAFKQQKDNNEKIDMRPMPEQRPPRRESLK